METVQYYAYLCAARCESTVARKAVKQQQPASKTAVKQQPASHTAETLKPTSSSLPSATVHVASWNLLADCYVRVNNQPWNAFAHCSDEDLAWESRQPKIQSWISNCTADVLALQEVVFEKRSTAHGKQEWQLPAWLEAAAAAAGFEGVMQALKQQDIEKNAGRNLKHVGRATPTGLATLVRSNRWEVTSVKHGSGSGSVLTLAERNCGAHMAVANTHLVGDPTKAASQIKQLDSLWKNLGPTHSRVICGDFNGDCASESDVGKWLSEKELCDGPTPASWAEPGNPDRLDHITFRGMRCVQNSPTIQMDDGWAAAGLPNSSCPSDHVPIQLEFELTAAPVSVVPAGSAAGATNSDSDVFDASLMAEIVTRVNALAPQAIKGKPTQQQLENNNLIKEYQNTLSSKEALKFCKDVVKASRNGKVQEYGTMFKQTKKW